MKTLADILGAPQHRQAVIDDIVTLIEAQAARRPGLSGISLRTALGLLRSARPDLLPRAVTRLLPEFAQALEPLYQRFRTGREDRDFSVFLQKNAEEARDALLLVADRRAETASTGVKNTYARLRPIAEAEVAAAIAPLSKLIRGYLD